MACADIQKKALGVSKPNTESGCFAEPYPPNRNTILQQKLPSQNRPLTASEFLASIYEQLQKIRLSTCSFINLPEKSKGRWGLGLTPAVMKRCHWVKPALVAPVKFTERTHDD